MDTKSGVRIARALADIAIVLVEVEGMKAANQEREAKGKAQAYNEEAFCFYAGKLRDIANTLF